MNTFDVLGWLPAPVHLKPATASVLRRMFEDPLRYAGLSDLGADFGIPVGTLRWWMRKKSLPTPSHWLQAARALRVAETISASPQRSIFRIGRDLGFSDHTAVVRLLRRQFGLTAREAREGLPPEVLMDRWWERSRRNVHA
jgi:methylphosphotriester-DNA--protein-cysteine methyltransferase